MQIFKINLPSIANTIYVQADSKPKVRAAITDRMTIEKVEGADLVKLARSGALILGAEDEQPVDDAAYATPPYATTLG